MPPLSEGGSAKEELLEFQDLSMSSSKDPKIPLNVQEREKGFQLYVSGANEERLEEAQNK